MTVQMCLLCFTVAFLLIHTSNAQGIPGYIPPLYNVPKYVNQGLNAYRQTQQITKAASGLGLPVPQTQKIVTNVALPLLPPAQKLATNAGLPLLPSAQRLGANVGLPLLPKTFPSGLPVLPQLPPTFAVGTKLRPLPASTLLLNANPSIPRISPLQIRSTGKETNSEKEQADTAEEEKTEKEKADTSEKADTAKEQADAAINPMNEVSDDEFKEVVGSSGSLYNETTTDEVHQTKTRSPDNKADELDYLSKAANPVDDIGSLIKKVGHGLKHTMEKIDTTLWPSHAKPEMKQASSRTSLLTFEKFQKLAENRNLTLQEQQKKFIDLINQYRNPAFRLPESIGKLFESSNPQPELKEASPGNLLPPFEEFQKWETNRDLTFREQCERYINLMNEYRNPEFRKPLVFVKHFVKPQPELKEASPGNYLPSFDEYQKWDTNRNLTFQELSKRYINLMNEYRNEGFRIPIDISDHLTKSRPELKEASPGNFLPSFEEYQKWDTNRNLTFQELSKRYINLMNEYRNEGFRIPIDISDHLTKSRPELKEASPGNFLPSFEEYQKWDTNRDLTFQEQSERYINLMNEYRNEGFRIPIDIIKNLQSRPELKEASPGNFSPPPFEEFQKWETNRDLTFQEQSERYINLMNEYRNKGFRIPIDIIKNMQSRPELKEASPGNFSPPPFEEFQKWETNRDLTFQEQIERYINLMNEYRNEGFRIPIDIIKNMQSRPELKEASPGNFSPPPFEEFQKWETNRDLTFQEQIERYINLMNEYRNEGFRIPIDIIKNMQSRPELKEASPGNFSPPPFEEFQKWETNRDLTFQEQIERYINLMNEYRNEGFRIPIDIIKNMQSRPELKEASPGNYVPTFEEFLKYPENRHLTVKEQYLRYIELLKVSRNYTFQTPEDLAKKVGSSYAKPEIKEAGSKLDVPFSAWANYPENRILTSEQRVQKYVKEFGAIRDPVFGITDHLLDLEAKNTKPENNPMNKLFESATKLADSFIDVLSRSSKNRNDLTGQMTDSRKDKDKEFASNQRNMPFMYGAAGMTEKDAQFLTNPNGYFYGNQQMLHPYSQAFESTYNQWNQPGYVSPTFDSAANLAHGINGFNNAGGYYKSNNPSEILSNPMTQYTAMYPVLSRTYRQMPPPPTPPHERPNPIAGLAHAAVDTVRTVLSGRKPLPPPPPPFGRSSLPPTFGRPPLPPPPPPFGRPLIKRSGSSGNIWDSAAGLADGITNIAMTPGKVNADQILGSTSTIFNAAKDLGGDIGKAATNPSSIAKISSDKLLGSSKQGDSLLNPINPIGTIMNSATNLGSKITNIALNPANFANSQLLGSAGPLSLASNQAVSMAGKIVNTALNPGMNGNGQLLQSLGPTYAGGFFPRNNPSGSIVGSATQLASQILNTAATNSGNIGKIPLLKSTPGIGNYAGALPLGSIFNSATKLAGDITNIANVPGKLLVR